MITIELNEAAQVIEFLEDGTVVTCLSYGEATRRGFRCEVNYEMVEQDGGRAYVDTAPKPDVGALAAAREEALVTLDSGRRVLVPCISVSAGGAPLLDILLPYDYPEEPTE